MKLENSWSNTNGYAAGFFSSGEFDSMGPIVHEEDRIQYSSVENGYISDIKRLYQLDDEADRIMTVGDTVII